MGIIMKTGVSYTGGGTGLPDGGTTGQVLTKQSATDGDADWADAAGGVDHVELTQAEYDALSQAEKENGTVYFVTDAPSGGGGGGLTVVRQAVTTNITTAWGSSLYISDAIPLNIPSGKTGDDLVSVSFRGSGGNNAVLFWGGNSVYLTRPTSVSNVSGTLIMLFE